MTKRKVLALRSIQSRPPLIFTLLMWVMLDHFDPAGWMWGAVGVLVILLWVAYAATLGKEEVVDPFAK